MYGVLRGAAVAAMLVVLCAGCGDKEKADAPRGAATETLSFSMSESMTPEDFSALLSDLADLGEGGNPERLGRDLVGGLRFAAHDEGAKTIRLEYEPSTGREGWGGDTPIANVHVSRAVVRRFKEIVETAVARRAEYLASPDASDNYIPFVLELRAQGEGGKLVLKAIDSGSNIRVVHEVTSTRLNIGGDEHGTATAELSSWTSIACTIGFHVDLDELNYFVDKAYGRVAVEEEGFDAFVLGAPYGWFDVTVDHWDDQVASTVLFHVTLADGSRVLMAEAPASTDMGELFIHSFNSAMSAMTKVENENPGSSLAFSVPYYYDDTGGGVVQVRVTGDANEFVVYYDLETPRFAADEEPPDPVEEEDPVDPPDGQGRLVIEFVAPDSVRNSAKLVDPLTGTIHGAVYRADDVTLTGPIDGAQALASITIESADLTELDSVAVFQTGDLPAGPVKVLGFFDVDESSTADDRSPDDGDPVTVPVTVYDVIDGETTTVTVRFDLVY